MDAESKVHLMPALTLAESPSGLVHLCQLPERVGPVWTLCGREINKETWGRIRTMDAELGGLAPSTLRRKIEMPCCDRCFPI